VTFRGEQLTPGKVVPQMIATLPVPRPVGVKVIDELPLLRGHGRGRPTHRE